MNREITLRGIVLGIRPVAEGSARVLLYTDTYGLVMTFAKSAREERSKLRAHLQEGVYGTYRLVRGTTVWRVTGATGTENAYYLYRDTEQRESLARVLSTVRQFVRGEGSDPYFFSTLFNFMVALKDCDGERIKDIECVAVLRLLASLGYVESSGSSSALFTTEYSENTLKDVRALRPSLIRRINESIHISGL